VSNAPILITFASESSGSRPQSADPHAEQKSFANPPDGSYVRMSSSPAVIRSEPGAIRADAEAAVPVRRWHRVQWQ
jgi:hypothetical protein